MSIPSTFDKFGNRKNILRLTPVLLASNAETRAASLVLKPVITVFSAACALAGSASIWEIVRKHNTTLKMFTNGERSMGGTLMKRKFLAPTLYYMTISCRDFELDSH